MTLESALEIALGYMEGELGDDPGEPRYAIVRAEMRESGWLFEFNSTAYLRTRSYLDLLGGNYPLLVRSDGTVTVVMEASVVGKAVFHSTY
jgi:hypothetical protein